MAVVVFNTTTVPLQTPHGQIDAQAWRCIPDTKGLQYLLDDRRLVITNPPRDLDLVTSEASAAFSELRKLSNRKKNTQNSRMRDTKESDIRPNPETEA